MQPKVQRSIRPQVLIHGPSSLWGQFLVCHSALPNTALAPFSGWLSSWAYHGCQNLANHMLPHMGMFLLSIPRKNAKIYPE